MGFSNEVRTHPYRTWKCLTLCFIYVGLGIICAFPGPTVLDLKIAVNSTLDQIALIIPIDASGHMFGSVIGAFALSYFDHQVIIMHSLLVMSISFLVIPYCRTLISIYITAIVNGLSSGFLMNAGNVWIIHMWGKQNTPFMQITHFAYGLGCFLGPIIAEPFLLQNNESKASHHDLRIQFGYAIGCSVNLLCWFVFVITYLFHRRNKAHPTRQLPASRSNSIQTADSGFTGSKSNITSCANTTSQTNHAYKAPELTTASCKTPYTSNTLGSSTQVVSSCTQLIADQSLHVRSGARHAIVLVASLFVHVTYGLELSFGILLPIYAVKSPLALSKSTASFLTSLYWACFTFPKLLAAAASSRVSARNILWIELFIISLANIFLVPFGSNCEWALWVGTALIGIGVSSIFPCLLGHLELLFPITGKTTSLFTTFSCIGEFVLPTIVGMYIESNPSIFLDITLLYSILSIVFFVIMLTIEFHVKRCHRRQLIRIQTQSNPIESILNKKSIQSPTLTC